MQLDACAVFAVDANGRVYFKHCERRRLGEMLFQSLVSYDLQYSRIDAVSVESTNRIRTYHSSCDQNEARVTAASVFFARLSILLLTVVTGQAGCCPCLPSGYWPGTGGSDISNRATVPAISRLSFQCCAKTGCITSYHTLPDCDF